MAGHFRAYGRSMEPMIPSGTRVRIEPVAADRIEVGDVVVANVGASTVLHRVRSVDRPARRVEISGMSGPANGWTSLDHVQAICTEIGGSTVPEAEAKVAQHRGLRRRRVAAD